MKALIEFDMTNFPRFLDGKTFRDRQSYSKYLISAGYAFDKDTPREEAEVTNAVEATAKREYSKKRKNANVQDIKE